ncbi:GNAT family N-acetyltransferase [Enterococcus sp. HY326]|uniref:GNAT family N-acetyltransferase n=1 Tax=Enterococcus sp. HY326 TaxID=2971265 RepID=UPI00223FF078|nr:GNAT family N-acetyltransferase [Enterococcus sp. HY326]
MQIDTYNETTDTTELINLVLRLADFSLPRRVDKEKFIKKQVNMLEEDLKNKSGLILTVKDGKKLLGFIQLQAEVDWISGEEYGYISRLVVSKEAEGQGIGQKLIGLAEKWAMENEYTAIGLNVFSQNTKAVTFYEKLGYQTETIKMMKDL